MEDQDVKTVSVVRIIRYTGTEEAVRACLSKSLAPGIHQRVGYNIAVSTHTSDLPELDYLCPSAVADSLAKAKPVEPSGEVGTSEPGPFMDNMIEDKAVNIYNSWSSHPGWVPWVARGNSTMQDKARRLAREFFEKGE